MVIAIVVAFASNVHSLRLSGISPDWQLTSALASLATAAEELRNRWVSGLCERGGRDALFKSTADNCKDAPLEPTTTQHV